MAGRDDSAGDYGTWLNPQDQSWLDYLKMQGSDVGEGVYNAFANITGALSPIGTSEQGNMALQVPPMVSGLYDSAKRIGQSPGFTGVPEFDEQLEQDLSNVLLSMYGGNALSGITKPRGALGTGVMREADALPMDHASRMARARELGFDTENVLYHGGNGEWRGDAFIPSSSGSYGPGIYVTTDPKIASGYAERVGPDYFLDGGHVTPLLTKSKFVSGEMYDDYFRRATKQLGRKPGEVRALVQQMIYDDGFSGVIEDGRKINVFNPSDLRSVNAAFDPAKADSANLLYSRGVPLPPQQDDNLPD